LRLDIKALDRRLPYVACLIGRVAVNIKADEIDLLIAILPVKAFNVQLQTIVEQAVF
jgi:hypothetical protein